MKRYWLILCCLGMFWTANSLGASPEKQGLIQAVRGGNWASVQQLLEQGALLDQRDATGKTPLIWSLLEGKNEVFQGLLLRGANPALADREGRTALMYAALKGRVSLLSQLLMQAPPLDTQDQEGYSALMLAAMTGQEDSLEALLKAGASLELKTHQGRTALMLAAISGQKGTVESLLKHGALLQSQDFQGMTALQLAEFRRQIGVVALLQKSTLPQSLEEPSILVLDSALEVPALSPPEAQSQAVLLASKRPAWLQAIMNDHAEALESWRAEGGELETHDEDGMTPLLWAVRLNRFKLARWLVAQGSRLEVQDSRLHWTPLLWAVRQGNLEMVRWLLEAGASPAHQDVYGWNALRLAQDRGNRQLESLLRQYSR